MALGRLLGGVGHEDVAKFEVRRVIIVVVEHPVGALKPRLLQRHRGRRRQVLVGLRERKLVHLLRVLCFIRRLIRHRLQSFEQLRGRLLLAVWHIQRRQDVTTWLPLDDSCSGLRLHVQPPRGLLGLGAGHRVFELCILKQIGRLGGVQVPRILWQQMRSQVILLGVRLRPVDANHGSLMYDVRWPWLLRLL